MKTTARIGAISTAAVLALCLWRAGIAWFNGGEGLAWLDGFQWGAIPVCAVIAAACATAVVARDRDPVRLALFMLLTWAVCFSAFAAGRGELYEMFGGSLVADATPAIRLLLYAVAVSVSLPWLASRLLAPLHWWTALLCLGALPLADFLAYLTVAYFPDGRHSDEFNAIRLGYPAFWIALLLPAALWGGVKR